MELNSSKQNLDIELNENVNFASNQVMKLIQNFQGVEETNAAGEKKFNEHHVPPDMNMTEEYQVSSTLKVVFNPVASNEHWSSDT